MDSIKKYGSGFILILMILAAMVYEVLVVKPYMVIRAFSPSDYVEDLWLSLDQHLNKILRGDRDETLSSRIGKHIHYGAPEPKWFSRYFAYPLFWLLHWFDFDHCFKAIDWTEGWGKQMISRPQRVFPSFTRG
ncbi:hypothetical protein Q4575_05295 [Psychrosphaera sp. 1_MG-2023]|uniref:hypothetical protein n=1 Tax=Psychrosphaera sp. 1_MG-2023 TaxID=3062643 RepID=UPI0026E36EC5|nr:hypothetical protein [Psychrosphaera sp. 1_MG-2023]MDO6718805.1 hypothetical protein [Psychrosphaera sp. 1_MG-2023]